MTQMNLGGQYHVQYFHQHTGKIVRLSPMSRENALELAQQLVVDGVKDVQVVDQTGQPTSMA